MATLHAGEMNWRTYSVKVIRQVIADNPGLDEPALRKKISEAYPFGERANHPYKMWLSEVKVRVALHFRKPLGLVQAQQQPDPDPNQQSLL
jgi:hypothetical protein